MQEKLFAMREIKLIPVCISVCEHRHHTEQSNHS